MAPLSPAQRSRATRCSRQEAAELDRRNLVQRLIAARLDVSDQALEQVVVGLDVWIVIRPVPPLVGLLHHGLDAKGAATAAGFVQAQRGAEGQVQAGEDTRSSATARPPYASGDSQSHAWVAPTTAVAKAPDTATEAERCCHAVEPETEAAKMGTKTLCQRQSGRGAHREDDGQSVRRDCAPVRRAPGTGSWCRAVAGRGAMPRIISLPATRNPRGRTRGRTWHFQILRASSSPSCGLAARLPEGKRRRSMLAGAPARRLHRAHGSAECARRLGRDPIVRRAEVVCPRGP